MSCNSLVSQNEITHDSAVEVELPITNSSVKMLTTEDGTLESLFSNENLIRGKLKNFIESSETGSTLLKFPFDRLSDELKVTALQEGIKSKGLNFSLGRKIPGIFIRPEYQQTYDLMGYVEMASPSTATDGSLIEVHLRTRQKPSTLAKQAARLQSNLGFKPGPMHLHKVFDLPLAWLAEDPSLNSLRLVDFWRRANLALEMRDVINSGLSILTQHQGFMTSFGPLGVNEVFSGLQYFFTTAKVYRFGLSIDQIQLSSSSKLGWIGLWGHDKYDAPGLFGFEYRALDGSDLTKEVSDFLDSAESRMKTKSFGIAADKMDKWMEYAGSDILAVAEKLISHRYYDGIAPNFSERIKSLVRVLGEKKIRDEANQKGAFRYLLHDWSLDPLFFGNPALATKIENLQIRALRKWVRGEKTVDVVQEFLIESGLYQIIADSVGLKT